jgi:hypothetical protein
MLVQPQWIAYQVGLPFVDMLWYNIDAGLE